MTGEAFVRAERDFDRHYAQALYVLDELQAWKREHPGRYKKNPTPWGSIEAIGEWAEKTLRALHRARKNADGHAARLRAMESDWNHLVRRARWWGFWGGALGEPKG